MSFAGLWGGTLTGEHLGFPRRPQVGLSKAAGPQQLPSCGGWSSGQGGSARFPSAACPQSVSLGTWRTGWAFTVRQSQCHFDFSFFAFEANNGLFLFPLT